MAANARRCPNCGEEFAEWQRDHRMEYESKERAEEWKRKEKVDKLAKEKKEEMTPEEAKTVGCLFLLLLVGLGIFFLYRQFIA